MPPRAWPADGRRARQETCAGIGGGAPSGAMAVLLPLAERVAAGVFGGLARGLRGRPLHPSGAGFEATFIVPDPPASSAPLLAEPGTRKAYVRFSRGFGLPEPLPEILSLAVKVPDADGRGGAQDFLMTATGERPILRHAFALGRSHLERTFSSVFAFEAGGERVIVGAAAATSARRPDDDDFAELEALAAAGELRLELRLAPPLGPWRTVARVVAGRRLTDDEERALRFNTDNDAGGISPVGAINAVRGAAYSAAGAARP